MNRIPFDHADEILLRLSDAADDERVRRLATSDATSHLDGFIRDVASTQQQIVAALRRKMARRGATTGPGASTPGEGPVPMGPGSSWCPGGDSNPHAIAGDGF